MADSQVIENPKPVGYRVVVCPRRPVRIYKGCGSFSVQYPQARPKDRAYMGHYSLDAYPNEDEAWAHARADAARR